MATLKLTVFKAKVLKDGRHKIRIAVCHKHETSYMTQSHSPRTDRLSKGLMLQ